MYDSSKIIPGLIIFVILVTIPVWYNLFSGTSGKVPDLVIDKKYKECVRPASIMRETHMVLLSEWRDRVVRDADRSPVTIAGVRYSRSLTNTCIKCHPNKSKFCDQCHDYLGVSPNCWDCHSFPKEELNEVK